MSRSTTTLPSNSLTNYHPDNAASQYTSKLNGLLELVGKWEVVLLQATFPSKTKDVINDDQYCTVHYVDSGKEEQVFIGHLEYRLAYIHPRRRNSRVICCTVGRHQQFGEKTACSVSYFKR